MKKAREEGKAVVRNLIVKLGLAGEQAANLAGLSVALVQQVRAAIQVD